jgi:hypothetical protein
VFFEKNGHDLLGVKILLTFCMSKCCMEVTICSFVWTDESAGYLDSPLVASLWIAYNIVSVKSARAMWKVLMVQNYDNDIFGRIGVCQPPSNPKPVVS